MATPNRPGRAPGASLLWTGDSSKASETSKKREHTRFISASTLALSHFLVHSRGASLVRVLGLGWAGFVIAACDFSMSFANRVIIERGSKYTKRKHDTIKRNAFWHII